MIERLELDLEEVLKSNDEMQMRCEEALGRAERLQNDVVSANLRADELAAANARLRDPYRYRLVDDRPVVAIPPEIAGDASAEPPTGSGEEAAR